jgi:hypothetical protein
VNWPAPEAPLEPEHTKPNLLVRAFRSFWSAPRSAKIVVSLTVLVAVGSFIPASEPEEPEKANPATTTAPTQLTGSTSESSSEAPAPTDPPKAEPASPPDAVTATTIGVNETSSTPPSPSTTTVETTSTTQTTETTQPSAGTTVPASGEILGLLDTLTVRDDPTIPGYSRSAWSHWDDINGTGCNAREDVLKAQVIGFAQMDPYDTSRCTIIEGDWYSAYDGVLYSGSPSELDIDHIVALSAAWRSGASTWNAAQRQAFANDPRNLIAVTASSNRSKSDDDVGDWRPIRAAWCATAAAIVQVKAIYGLSVDPGEHDALVTMLSTCGESDQIPFGTRSAPTPTTTSPSATVLPPNPTTTPATTTPTSGTPPNPGDTKNCSDFSTYAEAKAWFDTYYQYYGDVARLDSDGDLEPCESLPGAPG